jgi:hypothetical protein
MLRFGNKTLAEKIQVAANAKKGVELPRDRFVAGVTLHCKLVLSNSGGSAVNITASQVISLIKRFQIVANGNDYLLDVNGYRKHLFNKYLFEQTPHTNIPTSVPAGGTATCEFDLTHVFAVDPTLPFDVSALVPAHSLSSFNVYLEYDNPTSIDNNLSYDNSSEVEVTVKECYTSREAHREITRDLKKLYEIEISKSIGAQYNDFKYGVNLDVGVVLQRVGIFAYNSSNQLSDSVISAYRIKQNSPIDQILEDTTWFTSQAEDKRDYRLDAVETGFTMYDAENKEGGLNTIGLKSGDITFNANTSATGSVVLLHREIL